MSSSFSFTRLILISFLVDGINADKGWTKDVLRRAVALLEQYSANARTPSNLRTVASDLNGEILRICSRIDVDIHQVSILQEHAAKVRVKLARLPFNFVSDESASPSASTTA